MTGQSAARRTTPKDAVHVALTKDIEPYIGSKSKVSEVLGGQRELSLTMIRKLVTGLGIPAEALLREPGAQVKSGVTRRAKPSFAMGPGRNRAWRRGTAGKLS